MKKENKNVFDQTAQFAIPVFTLASQLAIAVKFPQWGLVLGLAAQPFWLYSSWKGYRKARQIGMFINTVLCTIIIVFGIVNYWVF